MNIGEYQFALVIVKSVIGMTGYRFTTVNREPVIVTVASVNETQRRMLQVSKLHGAYNLQLTLRVFLFFRNLADIQR